MYSAIAKNKRNTVFIILLFLVIIGALGFVASVVYDNLTIVVVTHAPQQAARVSQRIALFHDGRLVEVGDTRVVFTRPRERLTLDYLTGRYG